MIIPVKLSRNKRFFALIRITCLYLHKHRFAIKHLLLKIIQEDRLPLNWWKSQYQWWTTKNVNEHLPTRKVWSTRECCVPDIWRVGKTLVRYLYYLHYCINANQLSDLISDIYYCFMYWISNLWLFLGRFRGPFDVA